MIQYKYFTISILEIELRSREKEARLDQNLILAKLIELGFTEQEARIYIFLAKTGTHKVMDIARTLKINKVQVYRHLRSLQNRNFVASSLGCPAYFSATPFDKVIDFMAESKSTEAMLLRSNKETLLATLKLSEQKEPDEIDKFTVVENENTIYAILMEFFRKTQKEILIMIDNAYKETPNFEESHRITKANIIRGVKYRCIGKDNKINREYTKKLMKEEKGKVSDNFENRYNKTINGTFPCFFERDGKELVMSLEKDDYGYFKKIMVTNNKELINVIIQFFERVWNESEISEIGLVQARIKS